MLDKQQIKAFKIDLPILFIITFEKLMLHKYIICYLLNILKTALKGILPCNFFSVLIMFYSPWKVMQKSPL